MAAFDIGAADEKLSYLKGLCGARNEWFETADAIYRLDHNAAWGWPEPTADDDTRIVSARPLRQVQHVLGLLLGNPLTIKCLPLKETKANTTRAGLVERFLYGTLADNDRRFGAVLSRGIGQGLVRGWGAWFVGWDTEREKTGTDDGDLGNPIVWKPVDSRFLFYEPGGTRERFASVMYSIKPRRVHVHRECSTELAAIDPHSADSDEVEQTDYWWWQKDDGAWTVWNAVFAEGQELKAAVAMPNYDRLPYVTWFCQPAPYATVEDWGRGILWQGRETLKNKERVLSRVQRRLNMAADGVIDFQQTDANADAIADEWQYLKSPGAVNYLPFGYRATMLPQPPLPPEAGLLLQELGVEEQDLGMSGPPTGNLPGGDTDLRGVTFHGLADAAVQWLATDTDSLATTLQSAFELVMSLCQGYAGSRSVSLVAKAPNQNAKPMVVGLKGSDMAGYYVDVAVDTASDADRTRRQGLGLQLLNLKPEDRPFAKREIAERYFDNQDYERTKRYQLDELVEALPPIQQALATEAAQAEGLPVNLIQPSEPSSPPAGQPGPASSPGPGLPSQLMAPQEMAGSPGPMPIPGQMMMPPGGPPQLAPGGQGMPGALPVMPGQGM